nr:hypothetical protein [Rhodococcus wratislaviensis]GLK41056.1 hypothetical protein GCM10017611_79310 [Rhodococcus wratislaviensis]
MSPSLALIDYYTTSNSSDPYSAIIFADPTIDFIIMLPGSTIRGSGVEDLRAYIDNRGTTERKHRPIRSTRTGEVEFVYGTVEEAGSTPAHYSATARIDDSGRFAAYFVAFHPEVRVIE